MYLGIRCSDKRVSTTTRPQNQPILPTAAKTMLKIRPQYNASSRLLGILVSHLPIALFMPALRFLKSHLLLDFRNRQARVQALRARPRAVQNGVTSVQTHAVIQSGLTLLLLRVSRVSNPSVALHQNSRAKVFLRVPPVRGAGCRAAGAENAFVETIELLALLLGLQVFLAVWCG